MSDSFAATWKRMMPINRINAVLLALLGVIVCILLWQEWLHDPDLSHGFFMPLVFVFLLREARRGPGRVLSGSVWPLVLLLGLAGIAGVAVSGLYAAALGWSSAVVTFTMTAGYALLCLATVLSFSVAGVEAVPFTWPAVVACGLWVLAAPIPPGSYSRLSLGLQLAINCCAVHALHLLGVAAHQTGNVIELSHASVGIEDACSGVRSLISCVFAGFFLSAVIPLKPLARIALIVLSVPLALGMNFLRSLVLTLLVNGGIRIEGFWHDATGYSVLVVTAGFLALLAYIASRRPPEAPLLDPLKHTVSKAPALCALGCLLVVTAIGTFSFVNTQPSVNHDVPPPDLAALLPDKVEGWKVVTRDDLYQFVGTLRTDHLAERTYVRPTPQGGVEQITLYLAYWRPGQAPVSLVAMHTPDACWPGTGWQLQAQAETQESPQIGQHRLPTAEYRLFAYQGFPQYVWFWHLYDGRPISFQSPNSALLLLKSAWTYGFRHDGDQLFVRVSANQSWDAIRGEPFMAAFFARVHTLGL